MCGIAGAASTTPIRNREWLSSSLEVLHHRGPDASGQWWEAAGRVGLSHRRLAIIDLTPAGRQPMWDTRNELIIVFNGEIYNFADLREQLKTRGATFKSHTDTEVILAAYREWGEDCLSRLNGMFAFALYDSRSARLMLARDRAGEKPLFYSVRDGELRFASELKGLMADPALDRRVDLESLDCYLAMGFVPGERCMLQGVAKLPPAHALTFDLNSGRSRLWRYWELPKLVEEPGQDEESLLDELEALLADAVDRQLVADVPVGVLLSGGVDSSLVTAMAVRARSTVKTFTIRFPNAGRLDETEHARLIARHFGTEHVELDAEPSTVDLLPLLARQFDEPIIDSSMIPTFLVSRLVRRHCTVALGGDGGDELFGGYSHYDRLLWLERRFGRAPRPLRRAAAYWQPRYYPSGPRAGTGCRPWIRISIEMCH
jgi:asparagine synthase (glutamine-hydrolysing)